MKTFISSLASVCLLSACSGGRSETEQINPPEMFDPGDYLAADGGTGSTTDGGSEARDGGGSSLICSAGRRYVGFGNTELSADRVDAPLGVNRQRLKPFSSMAGEYARVVGATPALLTGTGATFGAPAARWYAEPQGSAVMAFTAYRIAFQGCLALTNQTKYQANPTAATATSECREMARKFWSREATSPELQSCVAVATVDTAAETAPKRRWAYTCAALLNSAGFLSY